MRRVLVLFSLLLTTLLSSAQQVATLVVGTDVCETDFISQANLGAMYHCSVQNVNQWASNTVYIGEYDRVGTIYGFACGPREHNAPYKVVRTDEVTASTCDCLELYVVPSSLIFSASCLAPNGNAVQQFIGEECTF
jgi:hypothetical protein